MNKQITLSAFNDELAQVRTKKKEFLAQMDGLAYERLIKILSLYRLTLGQARQEELLEYLFKTCDDTSKLKELFINLSPFYKARKTHYQGDRP